ncbi:unnamed protein product [Notodromas monacha]|uniref:WASP family protein member n=1 Tax=Notodromas monacha TaxID=399045 RepID=A0A7R9GDN9_9CRUS|nr:unnamed protein product [Notodromas monacha]CAG0918893.1 unnamed protein product [Notodromas monacha]
MPLVKRRVQPVHLFRASSSSASTSTSGASAVTDDREFVVNSGFCGLLRQLAHVTLLADSIFAEVCDEVRSLDERSKSVADRIDAVHSVAYSLDAKAVVVPPYYAHIRVPNIPSPHVWEPSRAEPSPAESNRTEREPVGPKAENATSRVFRWIRLLTAHPLTSGQTGRPAASFPPRARHTIEVALLFYAFLLGWASSNRRPPGVCTWCWCWWWSPPGHLSQSSSSSSPLTRLLIDSVEYTKQEDTNEEEEEWWGIFGWYSPELAARFQGDGVLVVCLLAWRQRLSTVDDGKSVWENRGESHSSAPTVAESSLEEFSKRKQHFKGSWRKLEAESNGSNPRLDLFRDDASELLDIETLKPACFDQLPDWEPGLDDVLDGVGGGHRVAVSGDDDVSDSGHSLDCVVCKLPTPQDRLRVLVHKCPPDDVFVDISGTGFDRMTEFRRSLIHFDYCKRKKKRRRRRRNTIAGDEAVGSDADQHRVDGGQAKLKSQKTRSTRDGTLLRRQVRSIGEVELTRDSASELGVAVLVHEHPPQPAVPPSPPPPSSTSLLLLESKVRPSAAVIGDDGARSSSGAWTGSGSADSDVSAHTSVESEAAPPPPPPPPPLPHLSLSSHSTRKPLDDVPFIDDGHNDDDDADEQSSVYSCDTEGYYTSFHVDTGISKSVAAPPAAVFGHATHATNSRGPKKVPPPPPKRTCSLERHSSTRSANNNNSNPKSNRDSLVTVIDVSMSPTASPNMKMNMNMSMDMNAETTSNNVNDSVESGPLELSDLDTPARVDDFKSKTSMTAHRIPSLCAITPTPTPTPTPPHSDDDDSNNNNNKRASTTTSSWLGDGSIPDLVPKQPVNNVSDPSSSSSAAFLLLSSASRTLPFPATAAAAKHIVKASVSPSNSLERRRGGARVTLGANGEVVQSTGSLTRPGNSSSNGTSIGVSNAGGYCNTSSKGVTIATAVGAVKTSLESASASTSSTSVSSSDTLKDDDGNTPDLLLDKETDKSLGCKGSGGKVFRIEPVKSTSIRAMPLFRGDIRDRGAVASAAQKQLLMDAPLKSQVAASLKTDGYVVRSLVKSPPPGVYQKLAREHESRSTGLATSSSPTTASSTSTTTTVDQFRTLSQSIGVPTTLCPLRGFPHHQQQQQQQRHHFLSSAAPGASSSKSFQPTQPPRLFTDADYGFGTTNNNNNNRSVDNACTDASSTLLTPESPKNDVSDSFFAPLHSSTPTSTATVFAKLSTSTTTATNDGNVSSATTSPESTRSSSPCSLGSTGSFDFEFRGGGGRRNSWAHPEFGTHAQQQQQQMQMQMQMQHRFPVGSGQLQSASLPRFVSPSQQQQANKRMSWAAGTKATVGGNSPGTSLQDFKKLLAKHGPNMNQKVSAVELLKYKPPSQPIVGDPRNKQRLLSIASRMGLRSASKFRPPKTDVLSCTIPEDEFEVSPNSPIKLQVSSEKLQQASHSDDTLNNNNNNSNNNSTTTTDEHSVTLDSLLESSLDEDLGSGTAVDSNSGGGSGNSSAVSSRSSSATDDVVNGNFSNIKDDSDEEKVSFETHL